VRELFRRLATLAGLRIANAALDVADAALRTAPGPDRGAPPAIEARVVVTDEPSRGLTYGAGFNPGPVDDSFLPRPSLEGLEAECRTRMATIAAMPEPRGWLSAREPGSKPKKRAELDAALDLYNLAVEALRADEEPT
jgi:hypothetical protein